MTAEQAAEKETMAVEQQVKQATIEYVKKVIVAYCGAGVVCGFVLWIQGVTVSAAIILSTITLGAVFMEQIQ